MSIHSKIRVRFAPAPTGLLHIGGLRTALFNWLFARHNQGTFLIRVEDTDTQRSSKTFMHAQLAALQWAGIQPDEPVVIQSDRLEEHKAVIEKLRLEGKAYPCFCDPQDIAQRAGTHQEDGELVVRYDKRCRDAHYTHEDLKRPHALRFKIPNDITSITFNDLIRGEITVTTEHVDDFVIARTDGRPIYNLVVVVDDAFMGITHIIRGEDHISNTVKQILLYRACGYDLPFFAHLPLILGASGNKLSKRDAAVSVDEYRLQGYLPDALINYLARLGWSHGDQELFTKHELISYFSLDQVGKKGAIFDLEKLGWVNSMYIQKMTAADIVRYLEQNLDVVIADQFHYWNEQQLFAACDLFKERVKTVRELRDLLITLHDGIFEWADSKELGEASAVDSLLHHIELCLVSCDSFTHDQVMMKIKECAKQLKISLADIARPVRMALTGNQSGPGVFALLMLLQKQESIDRIKRLRGHIARYINGGI